MGSRRDAWQYTRENVARFGRLPVGDYLFEVRAVDIDLNYSDEPATVTVHIQRPLERILLGSALALALLLGVWQTTRVLRRDRRLAAQNRDLIEQHERARRERAVEHIRAEAMAMNTTDDLAPVCGVLLREIQALGVPTKICEIAFIDEDAQRQHFYWAAEDVIQYRLDDAAARVSQLADGTTVSSGIVHINRWKHFADHWRRGEPRVSRWSESGVKFAAQTLSEDIGIGAGAVAELDMGLGALALTTPFQHGVVWTASSQIDEADVPRIQAVLRELADAFTVGYRRFLDFQRLEEQYDRLKLDRAIERVRTEAMAMSSSADLTHVAAVMFRALVDLGIDVHACGVVFVDEKAERLAFYAAMDNLSKYGITWDPATVHEYGDDVIVALGDLSLDVWPTIVEGWRRGDTWVHSRKEAETRETERLMMKKFGFDRPFLEYLGADVDSVAINVSFEHGVVWVPTTDIDQERIDYLKSYITELTKALTVGYVRFLDFQQLEE